MSNRNAVELFLRDIVLSDETLIKIMELCKSEMLDGLSKERNIFSSIKMLPAYIRTKPDGSESGTVFSIVLGGHTVKILEVQLSPNEILTDTRVYDVPEDISLGPGKYLFDYLASCFVRFVKHKKLLGKKFPVGFVFDFPCKKESLCIGRLLQWSKGYKCPGVIGQNVIQMLREAIQRKNYDVELIALVNDTTDTWVSCSVNNSDCKIGMIVGYGANICYMENVENIQTWKAERNNGELSIVNMELGGFGDNNCLNFLRTSFDEEVDQRALNPKNHFYEKMIAGMYLGELVRVICVACIKKRWLLNGRLSKRFQTPWRFKTKYLAFIVSDFEPLNYETKLVFEKMGESDVSLEDCEILRMICDRVQLRGAQLMAAGVAAVLKKLKRPYTVIAASGHMIQYHPMFIELVLAKTADLMEPEYKFDIVNTHTKKGVGAAMIAAAESRTCNEAAS